MKNELSGKSQTATRPIMLVNKQENVNTPQHVPLSTVKYTVYISKYHE